MSELAADHLPPQNLDAERSVLGSLLRDNTAIAAVSLVVTSESFYLDAHRKVFQAILDLHGTGGRPVDLVLLADELVRRGQLEDIGGDDYLDGLWNAAPTAANAEYYACIVRGKALVRSLIHASTEILRDAYEQSQPPEEMLAVAEQKVLSVAQMGAQGQTHLLGASLPEVRRRIDQRCARGDGLSGLATGYEDLDDLTAGWHDEELIILAARPSVGKTALCLNFLRHVVEHLAQPVFFASLEQSRFELAERLLCLLSGVNGHDLRRGLLGEEQKDKLDRASYQLQGLALHLDDTPRQTLLRIAANARRLHRRHALALVAVDYLQLVAPENKKEPRHEQVGGVARQLKGLARELKIPVLALAQLNREIENRPDPRPRLADLRDCLPASEKVLDADTGERIRVSEVVAGRRCRVWSLNSDYRLEKRPIVDAWVVGRQAVLRLRTRSGRVLRCTAGHRLLSEDGWREVRLLATGGLIAVPRSYPPMATKSSMTPGPELAALGTSDVLWDEIVAIEPNGEEEVYDLTISGLHNFCVSDCITHNSGEIEQHADVVLLMHQPKDQPDRLELLVRKQRNGPTGEVMLFSRRACFRFEDYLPDQPFA